MSEPFSESFSESFKDQPETHGQPGASEPVEPPEDQGKDDIESTEPGANGQEQSQSPFVSSWSLPPEFNTEAHGGPLGCCLGVAIGLLLSLLLGLVVFGQITASILIAVVRSDPVTDIRVATAFFAIIGAIIGGYIGWKVGKKIYREYEPPVVKDRSRKTNPVSKGIKS